MNLLTIFVSCCVLQALLANGQRLVRNFTSPQWPRTYPNSGESTEVLTASRTEQLSILIFYLYLNREDYVTFATGGTRGLVTKSCANKPHVSYPGIKNKETFTGLSTGNADGLACVNTYYTTRKPHYDENFNAVFMSVYAYQRCPTVRDKATLTQPNFYMASPLYPNSFPTGIDCQWVIAPPSDKAQRIQVNVETITLNANQYLQFSEGMRVTKITKAGTYLSSTNSITLKFSALVGRTSKGYHLSYRLVGCKSADVNRKKNANAVNTADFYDAKYELRYKCNDGWEFQSGQTEERYRCDGATWSWMPVLGESECVRKTCESLPPFPNGQMQLSNNNNVGSVATFVCNGGYTLVGNSTMVCNSDKTWSSDEQPHCAESESDFSCAYLLHPHNGQWECVEQDPSTDCTAEGSVQKLVCNEGHYLNGTEKVECVKTEWVGGVGHCEPFCCENLAPAVSSIPNLNYRATGNCYQDKVEFFCDTGYTLSGIIDNECNEVGNWKVWPPPSCHIVDCGQPPAPDGNTTSVRYQSTVYQSVATYYCNDPERFTLVGAEESVCGPNKRWSEEAASLCVRKECHVIDLFWMVPGAKVRPVSDNYYVDDNVTLTCSDTTVTVACTPTGWSQVTMSKSCGSSLRFLDELQSPEYPKPYKRQEVAKTSDVVTAEAEERIVFLVKDISLYRKDQFVVSASSGSASGSSSGSGNDSCDGRPIKAYDGMNEARSMADVIFTPTNRACHSFSINTDADMTNSTASYRGYSVELYAIESCPGVRRGYTLTESEFYIASPDYPFLFQKAGICSWFLAPASCSNGQRIEINLEYMSTTKSVEEGCVHPLSIGKIQGKTKTFCGYSKYESFLTDSCTAGVSFDVRTNTNKVDRGFFLSYRVTGCAEKDLPVKDKAQLLNPADFYYQGYNAIFMCQQGFYFESGAVEEYAVCDQSGNWQLYGADTLCSPVFCRANFTIVNGVADKTGPVGYGDVVHIKCNDGFRPVGNTSLYCTASGEWSSAVPSCISQDDTAADADLSCSPPVVLNGRLSCDDGSCAVECDQGYYPVDNKTVSCVKGAWEPSDVELKCLPLRCGRLPVGVEADSGSALQSVKPTDWVGSTAEFFCSVGYDLFGPNLATCTKEGLWEFPDSTVPECVLQVCDQPPVTTATSVDYFQHPVYNTTVTYSCSRGFDLVGSNELVCGPNSRWLGTVPYCVAKTCDTDQLRQLLSSSNSSSSSNAGSGSVRPDGLVSLNDFASVSCGNCSASASDTSSSSSAARAVCTAAGWNIDELYSCGCVDVPSPSSPSSLVSIANVTFDYESGTGGDNSTGGAYVVARSFITSSERNRLVFVASYLALKSGDVLSFHAGSASTVDGEQRCSAAPSKLLHTYSGEIGQINDVIYSNEAACTQLSVQSKSRSSVEAAYANDNGYGYRFEAYEMPFCPSPLQPAVLTESAFVLVSPHYPDSYLPFESCSWIIAPSDCRKGQRLDFVVDYAEISQPHSLRFTFDADADADADTPATTEVEISGSVRDKKFWSEGCDARVLFDTSFNVETNRGFEFSYEVTGCPEDSIPKPTDALVLGPSSGYHPAGSVVAFKCALGYQFTSGLSEEAVACTADYTWSQVSEISSCEPVQCAAIQEIENGEWSLWSSTAAGNETAKATYNATAKFKCNENYTLVGSETLVCGADGVWSASVPVCALPSDVYSCSTPASPTHGRVKCASSSADECLSHGATQTVVCNTGYHISNADGDGKIVCSNSTWIPKPESLCEVNCCGNVTDTIGTFANIVVQTGSCYRDFVLVGCPFGYTLSGSRRLDCVSDGTWSGGAANCSIVECDREEVELGTNGALQVAINGTTYGSVVRYWCEEGYDLVGESSRQCQANGKWSGITPQCAAKQCLTSDLESQYDGLIVLAVSPVYVYGEKVAVSCGGESPLFHVFCGANGWLTDPVFDNCVKPLISTPSPSISSTASVNTSVEVITTPPAIFTVPRYVMSINSPNYPDEYPSQNDKIANSVSNNGPSGERVVFGVRKSRLRPGDSLKLFSKPAASDSSCSLSSMVAQYEGGKTFGGAESDWVVTSTSTSCYMFETTDGQSSRDRAAERAEDRVGFLMDVYSLSDCPSEGEEYKLAAPSFALASPNYPNQFGLKKNCHWWIEPPCSQQRIRMKLDWVEIPCGNKLEIKYDGETKAFCGSKAMEAQVVETASCKAEVVFDSTQSASSASGFRLSYSVVGCAANQLPTRSNAWFTPMEFYEAGTVVKYSCVTGMRLKSGKKEEQVRCSEGYEWEVVDQPSECEMVTCPAVEKPANGQVNVTSNEYGATARFGCDEMFRLSGDEVQVCGADGAWNGTEPTCVAIEFKSCGDPSVSLPNSKLTCVANCTSAGAGAGGQYVHGTVLQTECKVGFESTSPSTSSGGTIRCWNGTWSPTVSDCSRICCKPLEALGTSVLPERSVEATAIVGGSCFNDSVTFKCGKAYKLVGSKESWCRLDKTWSTTAPYCEPVKCGKPSTTSSSVLVYTSCESFGCVATFSCVEGYKLAGSATLSCNENGEWGTLPTCSISTCQVSDLEAMLPAGASVSGSASTTGSVNFGDTVDVSCLSSTYGVRCGAYSWELGSLASRRCEPNYCLAEQLKEIASLTGTTLSKELEKETVAEGTSVEMVCESTMVAVATCGTVTWQTDISASEIRATCESFKTTISARTSTNTRSATTTTAGTGFSTRVTTIVAETSTPALHSTMEVTGQNVIVEVNDNEGLLIGLGVTTGVLAVVSLVALTWIVWECIRKPKKTMSIANPMFESNSLSTFSYRKDTDTPVFDDEEPQSSQSRSGAEAFPHSVNPST